MPLTDEEIGALFTAGRIDEWHKALAEQAEATAPRLPAPAEKFVTLDSLKATLGRIATGIVQSMSKTVAPLDARISEIERRLKALESKPAGLVIHAAALSVEAEGLGGLTDAVTELRSTLSQPVKPIYDSRGKLIGAERVQ